MSDYDFMRTHIIILLLRERKELSKCYCLWSYPTRQNTAFRGLTCKIGTFIIYYATTDIIWLQNIMTKSINFWLFTANNIDKKKKKKRKRILLVLI